MLTAEKLAVEVSAQGVAETRRDLNSLGDDAGDGHSSGWAGKLATAGMAAFAAVGAAAAGVAGYGLKVAADTESASIAFDTLLGPAADDFMTKLQGFAAATPFEFPELRDAASRMLAVGTSADDVIPIMTALGDATSAMGTGSEGISRAVNALGQMKNTGHVTMEDMNQLRDAGIPAIDALASHLGMTVADTQSAISAGTVGAQEMYDALESYSGDSMGRIRGMMDKQSQSLAGQMSTLKDTVSMGLGTMMGPAVELIKAQMPDITSLITDSMNELAPEMNTLVGGVISTLSGLLPSVVPVIGAVLDLLGQLMAAIGPTLQEIAPMIADMVRPIAGDLGPALASLIPPLGDVIKALLPVLPALAKSAARLAPPLASILEALAGIIEKIPPELLADLVLGFVIWSDAIAPLAGFLGTVVTAAEALGPVMGLVGTAMGEAAIAAAPWLLAIAALAVAGYLIYEHWDGIADFFSGVWDKITGAASVALDWLKDNVGNIGRVILGLLTGGMSEVVLYLARNWSDIVSGAGDMIGNVLGFFVNLPGNIVAAIGDIASTLWNVGHDVVVGLWNGISDMGSWLWDAVWGWVKDVLPEPVKWALGIHSPSTVMAELGTYAGMGLAQGILGTAGDVADAAGQLAAAAIPQLGATAGMGLPYATAPYAGVPASVAAAAGGSSAPVPITLELDGRVLAQVLVDPIRGELIATSQRTGVALFGGART